MVMKFMNILEELLNLALHFLLVLMQVPYGHKESKPYTEVYAVLGPVELYNVHQLFIHCGEFTE